MVYRVVVAIPDSESEGRVSALVRESSELEHVGAVTDAAGLRSALRRRKAELVIVTEDFGEGRLDDLIAEVAAEGAGAQVVKLVRTADDDALRKALHAGARDVIEQPLSLASLEGSVRSVSRWLDAARDTTSQMGMRADGQLVAVAGARGGAGASMVSVQLALAAARAGDASEIRLVDLDLQKAGLYSLLDLKPRRSILDLADIAEELSSQQLAETLYSHRSGVKILLGPEHGEDAEDVSEGAVRLVIEALRRSSDLTVVDLGTQLTEGGAVAAELADSALIVTTPDVPGLHSANRLIGLWQRLEVRDPEGIQIVINRTSRDNEVQPDLARRILEAELLETGVPAAFREIELAVNAGQIDQLGSSELQGAYERLGRELGVLGLAEPAEEPAEDDDELEEDSATSLRERLGLSSGQATVEAVGLAVTVIILALGVWQIVLVGYTFSLSGHAAREGADALAVGEQAEAAARSDLPTAWRDGMEVDSKETEVQVQLRVPVVLPGLDTPLKISSSAGTSVEDEPLPDSQAVVGPREGERG